VATVIHRVAERVAALERAFPDGRVRAQAVKDVEAFVEVMLTPGEDFIEWTADDLMLFAEAFVEQSGPDGGAVRFRNMMRVLTLLDDPATLSADARH
jgi:hypothetical protein